MQSVVFISRCILDVRDASPLSRNENIMGDSFLDYLHDVHAIFVALCALAYALFSNAFVCLGPAHRKNWRGGLFNRYRYHSYH